MALIPGTNLNAAVAARVRDADSLEDYFQISDGATPLGVLKVTVGATNPTLGIELYTDVAPATSLGFPWSWNVVSNTSTTAGRTLVVDVKRNGVKVLRNIRIEITPDDGSPVGFGWALFT